MSRQSQRDRMLELIRESIEVNGYGPSVRELCAKLGLKSTATVQYHLKLLAQEGRIRIAAGKKRAISLPDPDSMDRSGENPDLYNIMSTNQIPVPVVGTVAAGQPITVVEHIEGYLPWEGGEGWFALRVKGESMKNAGILPGDLVVVRPQPTAENGEIVVALLEDEATVKRFSRREDGIWLLPENEAFDPIDGRDASILGVVRGVVRRYQ